MVGVTYHLRDRGGDLTAAWQRHFAGVAEVVPATGDIRSVRFLAFGCPHVIAACQWVAEHAVGAAAGTQLPEGVHALSARLEAPVEKLGRFLIVEDAWAAALQRARRDR